MSRIFLSYAHEDEPRAARVKEVLSRLGHEVWFDRSEMMVGDPVSPTIEQAVQDSDYFVLFLTEAAARRPEWIMQELGLFLLKGRVQEGSLLPLKYAKCEIPNYDPIIRDIRHISLTDENEKSFSAAMEELSSRVGDGRTTSMSADDKNRLNFAISLAVHAGNTAMQYYNNALTNNDPMDKRKNHATSADQAAQRCIIPEIGLEYHEEVVISEEGHFQKNKPAKEGYTWVVDPLDGTINFMNRIPFFCTAIGLLKDRSPYLGVIFEPVTNEVYYTVADHRSYVWRIGAGETRRISTNRDVEKASEALIGTHISSRADVAARMFERGLLQKLSSEFRNLRQLGSGQLALAYVASGRLDGFVQLETYIWDMVAGVALLRNAGGLACDASPKSKKWTFQSKDIVASANESLLAGFQNQLTTKARSKNKGSYKAKKRKTQAKTSLQIKKNGVERRCE